MAEEKKGLCFRCEYRARFYETGQGMRCECHTPEMCVHSCYMYKPVMPVIVEKNKGDRRPQFAGAMISSRSHFVKIAESDMTLKSGKEGSVLYWVPKDLTQRKRKRLTRYNLLKQDHHVSKSS
jgi:hypothetical protein